MGIIRLYGIVGGVFATSTMLTSYGDSAKHLWRMIFGKSPSQFKSNGASPNSSLNSSTLSHEHLLTLSPSKTSFEGASLPPPPAFIASPASPSPDITTTTTTLATPATTT